MKRPRITIEAEVGRPAVTAMCSPDPTVYPLSVAIRTEFALGDHADALAALDLAYRDAVEQIHQASVGSGERNG